MAAARLVHVLLGRQRVQPSEGDERSSLGRGVARLARDDAALALDVEDLVVVLELEGRVLEHEGPHLCERARASAPSRARRGGEGGEGEAAHIHDVVVGAHLGLDVGLGLDVLLEGLARRLVELRARDSSQLRGRR